MNDLYSGTVGAMFDKDKLVYKLTEYMVNHKEPLNYEVAEDKAKVVIITGKNDTEKELPNWTHPVIFTDLHRNNVIAIDLRPFMVNKLDDMITVREKLQDKYNGTLQLYRLVFTKLMVDKEDNWLVHTRTSLMETFAKIMSTTTSIIFYDNSTTDIVEIMSKLHFLSLNIDKDEFDFEKLILKLSRDDIARLTRGDLKDFFSVLKYKYSNDELMFPSTTIGSLTHNIKTVITNGRADGLTSDIYIQALSRGFFSLDSKYLSIGLVEDLPTLVAVLNMVITEGINSKSSFRKIINSNKRLIKSKELSEVIIRTYRDELIEV